MTMIDLMMRQPAAFRYRARAGNPIRTAPQANCAHPAPSCSHPPPEDCFVFKGPSPNSPRALARLPPPDGSHVDDSPYLARSARGGLRWAHSRYKRHLLSLRTSNSSLPSRLPPLSDLSLTSLLLHRRLYSSMDNEDSSSSSSFSSNELSPSHMRATGSPSSSTQVPTPSPKRRAGRKKLRETRHPVYRGVRERNGGKWVCEVREPQKKSRIWLGTYPTPEMAARAHDVAAIALRGKAALLNFPDSAWTLPRAASPFAEDIRRAASKAAGMFRPTASSSPAPEVAEAVVFVDEEALFNMPGLLDDMARGMMLTPPAMRKGFDWDGVECYMDLSLWIDRVTD